MFAAAAALLLAAPGCKPKNQPVVTVVDDPGGAPPPGGDAVIADPAQPGKRPREGKPVRLQASVTGLGDMLQLVKQATTAWNPKNPLDAAAYAQAVLLQLGYGPGLWGNLDLAGPLVFDATFYTQDPTADMKLAGSVAATGPKGVMDAMPSTQRPQPLGNGLWELVQGDLRVLLREQPKALEFGLSQQDLARASGLAAEVRGRRFQVRADDLPPGVLSGEMLPASLGGLRRQISRVLQEATSAAIEVDAGTDRDLVLALSAAAPFERLGLGPLGPARTAPTALEGRLPAAPAFVVAIPWGSPELLHKLLDGLAKGAQSATSGGPFEAPTRAGLGSMHTLLDQVRDDVVFALYLSPAGEATLVVAAGVKDENAARTAARALFDATRSAVTSFNALAGDNKAAAFGIAVKPDAVKGGAAKGDVLTLTVPKNLEKDAEDAQAFLTRKLELEVVALVSGEAAVVAVGAGARAVAADIGGGLKSRRTSLGADGGLALARSASQGCHFCVGLDPAGLARFSVLADPKLRADKPRVKDLETAAATVARLGGALGFGVKLEPGRGAFAGGLSRSLLVLSPEDAAKVGKLWEVVAPPAPATPDKPLGGAR
jgi:hypothetical protein